MEFKNARFLFYRCRGRFYKAFSRKFTDCKRFRAAYPWTETGFGGTKFNLTNYSKDGSLRYFYLQGSFQTSRTPFFR
jgi:hypothetical protein